MLHITYIEVNNIYKANTSIDSPVDASVSSKDDIEYSVKDLFAIQEIGNEPQLFKLLINSLCPSIYGHELVKGNIILLNIEDTPFNISIAGILLSLLGGRKRGGDNWHNGIRSDSHILVVGKLIMFPSETICNTLCR
jgi:DNA helicase MCM8